MAVAGVATAKSLQSYLEQLRAERPGALVEVSRTVRPDQFEVTAILEHLDRQQRFPAVLFKNPTDMLGRSAEFPLVSNVFGTREACAFALGLDPTRTGLELSIGYSELEQQPIEPLVVAPDEAPVKERVLVGEDADVRILPIVRHFEMDLGPVLTMAQVMPGREGEYHDVTFLKSFYRDDPRRMVVTIHTPHLTRIAAEWERRGERAPVVNILGHHPAFYLGSLALAPFANNDYATIGGFLREPVRLVPSETWGERMLVPADAEIVVEAEMIPGERAIADPFGEVTRLYQPQCLRPVCEVTAITYRRGAIMQDIFSGHRGHWILGAIPKEGSMYTNLQRRFGTIAAVNLPYSGCSRLAVYIAIRKGREGQAKQIALAALNEAATIQTVVVVDDDIDVFSEQEVLWAVHTYVDPDRDVDLIRNYGDSVFTTAMRRGKLLIDATRSHEAAFPSRLAVPPDVMARIKLEEWLDEVSGG